MTLISAAHPTDEASPCDLFSDHRTAPILILLQRAPLVEIGEAGQLTATVLLSLNNEDVVRQVPFDFTGDGILGVTGMDDAAVACILSRGACLVNRHK